MTESEKAQLESKRELLKTWLRRNKGYLEGAQDPESKAYYQGKYEAYRLAYDVISDILHTAKRSE